MRAIAAFVIAACLAFGASPAVADLPAALAALKTGGHVVLMRHAITEPGTGDPQNFDLGDWTTQRNLDDRGRRQAQALGAVFGAAGVRFDRALSSAWRRCTETAELVLGGAGQAALPVEAFEPLNSYFEDRGPAARRDGEARAAIAAWRGEGNLLMTTHMVNVYGMIGRGVPQGGFLVLRPKDDTFEIVAEAGG